MSSGWMLTGGMPLPALRVAPDWSIASGPKDRRPLVLSASQSSSSAPAHSVCLLHSRDRRRNRALCRTSSSCICTRLGCEPGGGQVGNLARRQVAATLIRAVAGSCIVRGGPAVQISLRKKATALSFTLTLAAS